MRQPWNWCHNLDYWTQLLRLTPSSSWLCSISIAANINLLKICYPREFQFQQFQVGGESFHQDPLSCAFWSSHSWQSSFLGNFAVATTVKWTLPKTGSFTSGVCVLSSIASTFVHLKCFSALLLTVLDSIFPHSLKCLEQWRNVDFTTWSRLDRQSDRLPERFGDSCRFAIGSC